MNRCQHLVSGERQCIRQASQKPNQDGGVSFHETQKKFYYNCYIIYHEV